MTYLEFTKEELASEEWRDVAGYNGLYKVSNLGRIHSVRANRLLKPNPQRRKDRKQGYLYTFFSDSGHRKRPVVHRIVAKAFLGPCPTGYQVNHIDGDKHNNRATNLEYVTGSQNMRHSYKVLGQQPTRLLGESCPVHKLTDRTVREVRTRHASGESCLSLAREFGVGAETIRRAVLGRTWAHIS
jgi:hypothetical protein